MRFQFPYEIMKLFDVKDDGTIDTSKNYARYIQDNFDQMQKYVNEIIDSDNIVAGGILTESLSDSAITTDKLDNLAVNASKLDVDAVTTTKIQDLAVTNAKIKELAVTEAKIANTAITNAKIKDLAVETGKIKNLAVTNAKIDTVNAVKITPAYDGGFGGSGESGTYVTKTHNLGYFPSSMQLFGGSKVEEVLTYIYDESYYASMDIHWCSKTQVRIYFLDNASHGLPEVYRIFLFR